MRRLVYGMGVSIDGFIAGPGDDIEWSNPGEELHRFHNEQAERAGAHVYGRRLYETMRYWETAGENPEAEEVEREFARIWNATPRFVVSRTLERVEGGAVLLRGDVGAEVTRLKAQPGGEIVVGGAGLAATLIPLGLVDEYRLFVYPIVLGAGTPFLPPLEDRIALQLAETRRFGSGVVYLRYESQAIANS